MPMNSAEEEFIYELDMIYDAENRFLEAQQHMVRQTRNEPLMLILVQHIDETQQQLKNLKLVFNLIDHSPQPNPSEVVTGLIGDAQRLMQQTAINPENLDVVLVDAQMKMKNFEIVCYRNLIKAIKQIGQSVILYLIGENLQQEERILQWFEQYFYTMPKSGTRIRPL